VRKIPPHCDTLDGPVVTAAKKALDLKKVNLILPWVPKKAEKELKKAFEKTLTVRAKGKDAKDLSDYWFFETTVRLHREGEGEAYTGLKPAGLDEGPVVPRAEKAIHKGNCKEIIKFLTKEVEKDLQKRFDLTQKLKNYKEDNVDAARKYVNATLGFILFSHKLYLYIKADVHHNKKSEPEGHKH
jgi:hypothetical protein